MPLVDQPAGGFQFLPLPPDPRITGPAPFSSGVRAAPGFEIVRAVFQRPLPYPDGFAAAARHLQGLGRPTAAYCASEVRVPRPLSVTEFAEFNVGYRAQLDALGVFVNGQNPIARSNVAPHTSASETNDIRLYGFSYTVLSSNPESTFFLSAAPEHASVRPGETTPDALREKTVSAMQAMQRGMTALGEQWSDITSLGIYTVHNVHGFLSDELLAPLGPAAIHGLHWYYGPPPIVGIEVEIDVRRISSEVRL